MTSYVGLQKYMSHYFKVKKKGAYEVIHFQVSHHHALFVDDLFIINTV